MVNKLLACMKELAMAQGYREKSYPFNLETALNRAGLFG